MKEREIWEYLIGIAFEDGSLSINEQKLLKSALKSMDNYTKVMDEAMKDGIIDYNEKNKLLSLRVETLEKMHDVARKDQKISKEEYDLIFATHQILNKLENMASGLSYN